MDNLSAKSAIHMPSYSTEKGEINHNVMFVKYFKIPAPNIAIYPLQIID